MTENGFVTGPHRVDTPHPGLVDGLADLCGRVTVAGGAVGFSATDSLEDLSAAASSVVDDVRNKRSFLITIGKDHALAGVAVITPGQRPVRRHTGNLAWLMVDPELQGSGWGQQLHDAALAQAQALGLEKLDLVARSDQGLESFYVVNGWVERGRWPGAIRISADDERAEIWFTRDM